MTAFGPMTTVTVAVPEVQHQIDAYQLYLGYELVEHAKVTPQLAALWGRPALAGRRYALMLPGGAGQSFLRFVESRPPPNYRPFRHLGWNAAEIAVEDTDALAARLADSPFRIIGPPADLSFTDRIRATQILGPAREALYLTQIKGPVEGFDLALAKAPVDRVFVVILGGRSVAEVNAFYSTHFGVPTVAEFPAVVSVIADAFDEPADTPYPIAAVPLAAQTYLEIDAMPTAAEARGAEPGELPAAVAMVSFRIGAIPESSGLRFLGTPQPIAQAPYHGRRAAVCEGAAGELIELIEA
jgi:hypothetical protein